MRPIRYDLGYMLIGDFFVEETAVLLQLLQTSVLLSEFLLQLRDGPVAQLGNGFEVAGAFGDFLLALGLFDLSVDAAYRLYHLFFGLPLGLFRADVFLQVGHFALDGIAPFPAGGVLFLLERQVLDFELAQAPFHHVNLVRHTVDLDAQAGGRFVNQVNGFIREKTAGYVTVAQRCRCDESGVLNTHAVVHFVLFLDAAQYGDGAFDVRLPHEHRLKPAFECGVFLDVFAVFVKSGRSDAMQLAPRKGGFQHVRGVYGALGGARADERVQLVDKEHDLALAFLDFPEHCLHPVLEFASELRPGDKGANVQCGDLFVLEVFGNVSGHNALRQAFHDSRLANAGFADQDRVVLCSARQHLDHAPDLGIAPDNRVKFPCAGQLGQVAAVFCQSFVRCLGIGVGDPLGAAHLLHGRQQVLVGRAVGTKHFARRILAQGDHPQQHMLCAKVQIFQGLCFFPGGLEHAVCDAAQAYLRGCSRNLGQGLQPLLDSGENLLRAHAQALQD